MPTAGLKCGAKLGVEGQMAIPKRELGRTGLPVTVLGYGAMELRGVLETSQGWSPDGAVKSVVLRVKIAD